MPSMMFREQKQLTLGGTVFTTLAFLPNFNSAHLYSAESLLIAGSQIDNKFTFLYRDNEISINFIRGIFFLYNSVSKSDSKRYSDPSQCEERR
jgi:hypothetical protein